MSNDNNRTKHENMCLDKSVTILEYHYIFVSSIPIPITPGIKKFYKQDITVCINIVSIKQDMIDCLLFFHVCLFTQVSTTSRAAKALEVEHFGFCSHHLVLAGVFIIYLIFVIFLNNTTLHPKSPLKICGI